MDNNGVMNLTLKGLKLYGKIQHDEASLKISRIAIGTGYLSEDETALDIAALKNEISVDTSIKSYEIIGDGKTKLTVQIETASEDYFLREIGIMATDPDEGEILYAYCNYGAYADFLKSYNGTVITTQEIDIYTAIGNAQDLIIDVSDTSQASIQALRNHTENHSNPHKVTAEQVGFTNKKQLDMIDQSMIDNIKDGIGKNHSHKNLAILDNIDSSTVAKWSETVEHVSKKNNPHNVTAAQIGLGKVTNQSKTEMFKEFAEMIEKSNICDNTDEYVSINIGEDKTGEFREGYTLVNEDVVISGIGGYPRTIEVSFNFTPKKSDNYYQSHADITITFSGVTLSASALANNGVTGTGLLNYNASFSIKDHIEKTTKDTFTFHVKATIYSQNGSNTFYVTKGDSDIWTTSIPKTQYLIKE